MWVFNKLFELFQASFEMPVSFPFVICYKIRIIIQKILFEQIGGEEEIAFGDLLRGEAYMRLPSAKAEAAFSFVRSREQAPFATK